MRASPIASRANTRRASSHPSSSSLIDDGRPKLWTSSLTLVDCTLIARHHIRTSSRPMWQTRCYRVVVERWTMRARACRANRRVVESVKPASMRAVWPRKSRLRAPKPVHVSDGAWSLACDRLGLAVRGIGAPTAGTAITWRRSLDARSSAMMPMILSSTAGKVCFEQSQQAEMAQRTASAADEPRGEESSLRCVKLHASDRIGLRFAAIWVKLSIVVDVVAGRWSSR